VILDKCDLPAGIRKLRLDELRNLSEEVRALILDVVSKQGGHLASSLGAVELCIALHYCLDAPKDTIIFDVGHQAYAHKIITGRKDSFPTLRTYKGISGFPNFDESEYDVYISGHASTAVSWAQGIAEAKKMRGDTSKTVAVIGDGSLTGGMCFEALNNCGHAQTDILVIVNHNEMSISPSVGALSNYLTKIISRPIYNRIKNELENFLKTSTLGQKLTKQARKFEESVKGLIVPGIFFEELGFRYLGVIDGHNFEVLIPTLKNILSLSGPRVLHIVTKKGKGHKPSEDSPEDFHSATPISKYSEGEKKDSFGEVFSRKLASLAKDDNKIVAITAAMPAGTGLSIFGETFPKRLFDVGIAEEHAVGFSSGLAKQGYKPVVAIYSTFLQRAFDQIVHDVALQKAGVVFALDRAGLVGEDGPTHHGMFDIAYLRLIPNMVCMAPKDKEECEDMLAFALSLNLPAALRYPKGTAYSLNKRTPIVLGKSEVMSEGSDVCIVALGATVPIALECVSLLKKQGVGAAVINARFIKPLDEEMLKRITRTYPLVVTFEEGSLSCGFGSAVLELCEQKCLLGKAKLIRAGFPDEFIPAAKREELFALYGLDADSLAQRINRELKRSRNS